MPSMVALRLVYVCRCTRMGGRGLSHIGPEHTPSLEPFIAPLCVRLPFMVRALVRPVYYHRLVIPVCIYPCGLLGPLLGS